MKTELSEKLFAKANTLFPGGVNSPVRAFRGVGGTPRFMARGEGCRMWDADGNAYIDYIGSWGPLMALGALRNTVGSWGSDRPTSAAWSV